MHKVLTDSETLPTKITEGFYSRLSCSRTEALAKTPVAGPSLGTGTGVGECEGANLHTNRCFDLVVGINIYTSSQVSMYGTVYVVSGLLEYATSLGRCKACIQQKHYNGS